MVSSTVRGPSSAPSSGARAHVLFLRPRSRGGIFTSCSPARTRSPLIANAAHVFSSAASIRRIAISFRAHGPTIVSKRRPNESGIVGIGSPSSASHAQRARISSRLAIAKKTSLRSLARKNRRARRPIPTIPDSFGRRLHDGWDRALEPRSRFAEWKRRRKT